MVYQDICTFKFGVRTGILMLPKLRTACITSFASANYKIKKHNELKSDGMQKDNYCEVIQISTIELTFAQ